MKRTAISAAVLAMLTITPWVSAHADELSDLKAELAAQRKTAAEQQARMDALEQKLNAAQTAAPPPTAAGTAVAGKDNGVSFKQGEGITLKGDAGFVSLYGLIDASYIHANNAGANGASVTSPRVAWFSGNRWGLTGARKLGSTGMNVIFRLESEFESQTGAMDTDNVLFNRDAWVGIESPEFGKLTLGRQNALARDPIASDIYGDPYGSAAPTLDEGGYTNNNNFKQLVFYAGSATGTRLNNGVVWKKAFFDNKLYAGAAYQFGGIPGSFSTGSSETLSLAYAGGKFNLAGFVTSADVAGRRNRSYSLGGNYQLGTVRLNAGAYHFTANQDGLGNRSDNAYTVSAKWVPKGSPVDYALGYQNMKAKGAAVDGNGNIMNAFANTVGATATATGSRSTIYGSATYHFDKITEVYFATDYLKLKDDYRVAATHGAKSQMEYAIGLRTRF